MKAEEAVLKVLLRSLVILNVLDGLCTMILVGYKIIKEANPLMSVIQNKSSLSFFIAKMLMAVFSVGLLWVGRKSRWALPATLVLVCLLVSVVCVQLAIVYQTLLEGI